MNGAPKQHSLRPRAHGTVCKCGAPKMPPQWFCSSCTARLPADLLAKLQASTSWAGARALIRQAVDLLGLPSSKNAQRKQIEASS